ncbi:hypothetical protein BC828DRAFT_387708 [Blastocladiella britannica]|nr:hypothetical protein BC828DRAFT_387708 [Blastocladiella britannica]
MSHFPHLQALRRNIDRVAAKIEHKELEVYIHEERDVVENYRTLAVELRESAEYFIKWGTEEDELDIRDVSDKAGSLVHQVATSTSEMAAQHELARAHFKKIRDHEIAVQPLRDAYHRADTALTKLQRSSSPTRGKGGAASSSSSSSIRRSSSSASTAALDARAAEARADCSRAELALVAAEAELAELKRVHLKAALHVRFDALRVHAARLAAVASCGARIADQLPVGYPLDGQQRPAYRGSDATIQLVRECMQAIESIPPLAHPLMHATPSISGRTSLYSAHSVGSYGGGGSGAGGAGSPPGMSPPASRPSSMAGGGGDPTGGGSAGMPSHSHPLRSPLHSPLPPSHTYGPPRPAVPPKEAPPVPGPRRSSAASLTSPSSQGMPHSPITMSGFQAQPAAAVLRDPTLYPPPPPSAPMAASSMPYFPPPSPAPPMAASAAQPMQNPYGYPHGPSGPPPASYVPASGPSYYYPPPPPGATTSVLPPPSNSVPLLGLSIYDRRARSPVPPAMVAGPHRPMQQQPNPMHAGSDGGGYPPPPQRSPDGSNHHLPLTPSMASFSSSSHMAGPRRDSFIGASMVSSLGTQPPNSSDDEVPGAFPPMARAVEPACTAFPPGLSAADSVYPRSSR